MQEIWPPSYYPTANRPQLVSGEMSDIWMKQMILAWASISLQPAKGLKSQCLPGRLPHFWTIITVSKLLCELPLWEWIVFQKGMSTWGKLLWKDDFKQGLVWDEKAVHTAVWRKEAVQATEKKKKTRELRPCKRSVLGRSKEQKGVW